MNLHSEIIKYFFSTMKFHLQYIIKASLKKSLPNFFNTKVSILNVHHCRAANSLPGFPSWLPCKHARLIRLDWRHCHVAARV